MATPLVLYKMDQASSGTTPTTLNDTAAGTAVNLTIGYGTATAWTSITAGDGISFDGTGSCVSGSLSGTKVATALAGATKCTLEFVVNTTSVANFRAIGGIQSNAFDDILDLSIGGASAQISVNWPGGSVAFDCPTGLHHIMVVLDNTQAVAANRVIAYVDGSLTTVNPLPSPPTYPALNAALDAGFTNWANNRVVLGCLTNAAGNPYTGPIYFAALYAAALTAGDASSHSTALLANNDADPNGAAAVQVPYRRPSLSTPSDEEYIQVRRARVTASGPNPPARVPYRRPTLPQEPDQQFLFMGLRSATIQSGPTAPDNPPWGWPQRVLSLFRTTEEDPGRFRRPTVTPSGPVIVPDNPPWGNPRRVLGLFRPDEEFQPSPQSRKAPAGAPVVTPDNPPWGWPRRLLALFGFASAPDDPGPNLAQRRQVTASGPTPPPPPPPPSPAPPPGYALLANQTTGDYDPNISLAVLLSVQDATGTPIAQNSFLDVASPFNDYALGTAGLLGPIRIASGRDLRAVKDIVGNARRVGASNTPEGSMVQYPHLVGAMGLSFQMVGLMDLSGATYANVLSAAQTGGIYRFAPQTWPQIKDGG